MRFQMKPYLVMVLFLFVPFMLAFTDGDTDAAWRKKHPTATPTARATHTPTPLPPLEACQIVDVIFDQSNYQVGDTIFLTVVLADSQGNPLIGANVDATVSQAAMAAAQIDTPIDLEDLAGRYDGVYTDTLVAGNYTFAFTASDPSGSSFLSCSTERTVPVTDPPTVTPILTATATPTNTPTPTPTPNIPTIGVNPPAQTIDLCGTPPDISTTVAANDLVEVSAVQLEITYDPAYIQVIDALGRPRPPVQVGFNPIFGTVLENRVDTGNGKIYFSGQSSSGINGSIDLIFIDWRLQGRQGTTTIGVVATLTDSNGQQVEVEVSGATLNFIVGPDCRPGNVHLQGRTSHGGVTVSASSGSQSQSYPNGFFAIASAGDLTFTFPGYYPETAAAGEFSGQSGPTVILYPIGDVNGDAKINIMDLAFVGQLFGTTNSTADLNQDGAVDIRDLVIIASNFWQ